MAVRSQRIEFQVYLRNNEKKILRKFRKITNPLSWFYGHYSIISPISIAKVEKAKRFFASWKDTTIEETIFPDLLLITTTKKEMRRHTLPKFIEQIESELNFKKSLAIWKTIKEKDGVIVLPEMIRVSKQLKRRYNLECMIKGIEGKTILCSVDNFLGDLPAVTVFSDGATPKFSHAFSRKESAEYQHPLVNIYLWDPESQEKFRSLSFQEKGRASPDLFVKSRKSFIDFVQELNRLRIEREMPPLGFMNYFLYQNAYIFRKKMVNADPFPSSYAIWDANSGLGKPNLEALKREVLDLRHPKLSLWESIRYHFGLRSNLMS